MTPVAAPDGNLYVAGWTAGADPDDLITRRPGRITQGQRQEQERRDRGGEIPEAALKQRFLHFDRNKDGTVVKEEWD
jgi:hypothetical protein